MPDWYPEEELERHGIAPVDFSNSGVYCLDLQVPSTLDQLRRDWGQQYTVSPPEPLVNAVEAQHALAYVGAAKRLRARLADHVRGDVRQAGVLAVCPATGVRKIWVEPDPFTAETGHAIAMSQEFPNLTVYCDGDWY